MFHICIKNILTNLLVKTDLKFKNMSSFQKTYRLVIMAGLTGFEPVMTGSEPVALPLGDSPI